MRNALLLSTTEISIRAPHAGSDQPIGAPGITRAYFNPRSPCGERPLHFVASLYYRQNIVFSKTVAANSAGKSRKTAVKNVIAWCEPLS